MLFIVIESNFLLVQPCNSTIVYQSHVARKIDVSCKRIREFRGRDGSVSGERKEGASVATGLARKRGEKRAGQLAVCACATVNPLLSRSRFDSLSLSLSIKWYAYIISRLMPHYRRAFLLLRIIIRYLLIVVTLKLDSLVSSPPMT